ncbi:hypothetical protein [Paenirhodobacter populi]|uniref:Uncharacterized protein n=1 Tax=Paenirhodobacter populi TaxID=2306993 RepID=A0A443KHZ0_9RHOB|nr:hypothetical protein [Sinirhodobacter populi]RWR07913.1 hypothetical protein D2T32_09860 [Sinirhodobacter populi]RWR30375.1 hypothetical protein D2T31_08120 [Sinirhodobacter populi]RWR32348.1 hypothetical protein D2T29_09155 [Sinirhodobacter populi]
MTTNSNRAGAPSAAAPSRNPTSRTQPDLGWREFFERLGNGTLPAAGDRKAREPIRSFSGYMTGSDSR